MAPSVADVRPSGAAPAAKPVQPTPDHKTTEDPRDDNLHHAIAKHPYGGAANLRDVFTNQGEFKDSFRILSEIAADGFPTLNCSFEQTRDQFTGPVIRGASCFGLEDCALRASFAIVGLCSPTDWSTLHWQCGRSRCDASGRFRANRRGPITEVDSCSIPSLHCSQGARAFCECGEPTVWALFFEHNLRSCRRPGPAEERLWG